MVNMDTVVGEEKIVLSKDQPVVRKVNEVKAHQMPALVLRGNVEVNDIDCASLSDTALRLWLNYFISSCTLY